MMEYAGYAFVVCYHQMKGLPTSFMMNNKNVGFGDEGLLHLTGGPPVCPVVS